MFKFIEQLLIGRKILFGFILKYIIKYFYYLMPKIHFIDNNNFCGKRKHDKVIKYHVSKKKLYYPHHIKYNKKKVTKITT